MEKGRVFCGLAIMVGLVVLGAMFPRAVEKYRSFDRVVNVKGLCEKEVMADKVIWPVVYKVISNDIQSIYDQTDAAIITPAANPSKIRCNNGLKSFFIKNTQFLLFPAKYHPNIPQNIPYCTPKTHILHL